LPKQSSKPIFQEIPLALTITANLQDLAGTLNVGWAIFMLVGLQ
jgi:hypothetical protein